MATVPYLEADGTWAILSCVSEGPAGHMPMGSLRWNNHAPENPEEAVLSACSTLISVVKDGDSRIVQFSHFSVKEFLTSDRFRTSDSRNDFHYYIRLDDAHTILVSQCCCNWTKQWTKSASQDFLWHSMLLSTGSTMLGSGTSRHGFKMP